MSLSPPTAGALRAAKKIYPSGFGVTNSQIIANWDRIARLIDSESGLPELVAALESLLGAEWMATIDWCPREKREEVLTRARAALSKAQTP